MGLRREKVQVHLRAFYTKPQAEDKTAAAYQGHDT
jgi:hypothetical protein